MKLHKNVDLLRGRIASALFRLAMPIVAGSIMGLLYNLTDMFWVGSLGFQALAAVGTGGMVFWFSEGILALVRSGTQITVGHTLGREDREDARRLARTGLKSTYILAVLVMAILISARRPLVAYFRLNEATTVAMTETYLWIVALGLVPTFGTRVLGALYTVDGNSKPPFLANTIGLIVNMALDPLFILVFKWGVAGAAWATTIAQTVAWLLLLYIMRGDRLLQKLELSRNFGDWYGFRRIFRTGYPIAAQAVARPFLASLISRIVAGFGDLYVAAQRLGVQVESISWLAADAFGTALNAFTAQNHGAGNRRRVRAGFGQAILLVSIFGIFTSLLLYFGAGLIASFFVDSAEEIVSVADYLRIAGVSQWPLCLEIVSIAAFTGLGRTFYPALIGVSMLALRVPMSIWLASTGLGIHGVWWTLTITSILSGLILSVSFALYSWRYERQGEALYSDG